MSDTLLERRYDPRLITLHLLRLLALVFLVTQASLQLRDLVNPLFQGAAVFLGVFSAFALERGRLRLLPALLAAAVLPLLARGALAQVFALEARIAPGPAADLLLFYLDKDFLPGLLPYAAGWLLTFLTLRVPRFFFFESCVHGALLVAILWTQARYRLSLYPHPALFAGALASFVLVEIGALLAARSLERSAELAPAAGALPRSPSSPARKPPSRGPARRRPSSLRPILSFAWVVLPLILVFLLFLLGRYREGAVAAGGGLMKPTLFRFDFSPYVRLESEIRTSEEPVLMVRIEGKPERWLLRRFVLSGYNPRQGFFAERGRGDDGQPTVVPDDPLELPDPGWRSRRPVQQEYFFLSIDPTSLIAVNQPVSVTPLVNWKSSSFLRVYRVRSQAVTSPEAVWDAHDPPPMKRDLLAYYTRYGDDQRIRELALEVTKGIDGYADKVLAIDRWLKANYRYSLKPGLAADGNQLHHFLFESKKGYCSYFAFAMALMARSLGIPARVAVGFNVPPETEVLNFYEVRAFQAHAWVEVWFGDLGWVEFDPTSQTIAPGEEITFFQGPDKEKLAKLIQEILDHQQEMEVERSRPADARSALARAASEVVHALSALARLWYAVVPALYVAILAALKVGPSLALVLARDPRRKAKGLHQLALAQLAGVGLKRRARETPLEFARRIRRERGIELPPLTESWLAAAFSPRFGEIDLDELREARTAFVSSYRRSLPAHWRLLGLLNPDTGSRGQS